MRYKPRFSLFVAGPTLGDEPVTHPGLGLNVLAAGFAFEFLAQLADEDSQVLRLMRRLRAPHRRQQGAVSHHLSRVAGKVQQQIELFGREVNGFALDQNAVGPRVDHKVAGFKGGRGALRRAAQMRSYASQQLLNAERLVT